MAMKPDKREIQIVSNRVKEDLVCIPLIVASLTSYSRWTHPSRNMVGNRWVRLGSSRSDCVCIDRIDHHRRCTCRCNDLHVRCVYRRDYSLSEEKKKYSSTIVVVGEVDTNLVQKRVQLVGSQRPCLDEHRLETRPHNIRSKYQRCCVDSSDRRRAALNRVSRETIELTRHRPSGEQYDE